MEKTVRCIHVVPAISEEASGPSYSVVRLCDSLVEKGEDIRLIALDLGPIKSPPSYLKTFPLGIGPKRFGFSPGMRRWLSEVAASGGADIIHNHGMWQMNAVYPGWATRGTDARLVVSPRGTFSSWAMNHGSRMKPVIWTLLQRRALTHAACFHATAESEHHEIRRLGFRQPVAIIPNGIDIPILVRKKKMRPRSLLFLGRIHPKKGIENLLHAWNRLYQAHSDWQLVIAGSDRDYYGASGYLKKIQGLALELGLKRVHFVGELQGMQKLNAYQDAELFLLPTHNENFGMTVAEALAAGTPAIVTKGAPWQGLKKKQCGWWIDIGVDALATSLAFSLKLSPGELEVMGIRGRNWMIEDFSWHRIGQMMDQTYRWLVRDGDVPGWVRLD